MIRASDLIGCVVRTESGSKLGKVHDLRAHAAEGEWRLAGLIVGAGGMLARLTGSNAAVSDRNDMIPWEAITRLEDGLVTVRDA
jgi:sporulation protein YlmC with PRC-barrel domain